MWCPSVCACVGVSVVIGGSASLVRGVRREQGDMHRAAAIN